MKNDLIKSTMILAMQAVMEDTDEYRLRDICRWYSETKNTALWVVEYELPIEHVLQHYYEEHYSKMNHISRRDAARLLIETDEEKQARLEKAKKDKARGLQLGQELAEKGLDSLFKKFKIKGPRPESAPTADIAQATKDMLQGAENLKDVIQDLKPATRYLREAALPDSKPTEPDLEITFGPLAADDDFDLFGPSKPTGKKTKK